VLNIGEGGSSLLNDLNVPISHMWSPSFVPRCLDWPIHVDVVGDFTRAKSPSAPSSAAYTPDPRLEEFLESCGEDKPIYIGFGSMVIADPAQLVTIIKVALSPSPLTDCPLAGVCSCHWVFRHLAIRVDQIWR
jgi:hypothetical protein